MTPTMLTTFAQSRLGVFHALLWITVGLGVRWIFDANQASGAYGSLCAWWVTMYAALLLGTSWRALPTFVAVMSAMLLVDTVAQSAFVYHDAPPIKSLAFARLAVALIFVWISPLLLNLVIVRLRQAALRR